MTEGEDTAHRFLPRIQQELDKLPLNVEQRDRISRSLLESAAYLDSQGLRRRPGKLTVDSTFFDLESRLRVVVATFARDGLTFPEVLSAVARQPKIADMSADAIIANVHNAVVQFGGDGLTQRAYLTAAIRYPILFMTSPATNRANIEGVAERFAGEGLSMHDYLQAATKHPSLFAMSPPTIEQNIRQAADRLGLEARPYLQAALRHPSLFVLSPATVEGNVRGCVELLDSGHTATEYARAALKQPSLFGSLPETVERRVSALVEHFAADGLTRPSYLKAALKQPSLFVLLPETVARNITGVVDRYAADGMTAQAYLRAAVRNPPLFAMSPDTIARHIDAVLSFAERGIFHPPAGRHSRGEHSVLPANITRAAAIDFLLKHPTVLNFADDNFGLRETHQRLTDGPTDSNLLNRPRYRVERELMAHLGHSAPDHSVEAEGFVAGAASPTEEQARRFVLRALMHAGLIKGGSMER